MNLRKLKSNSSTFGVFSTSIIIFSACTSTDLAFSIVVSFAFASNSNPVAVSIDLVVNVIGPPIPTYPSGVFVSVTVTVYVNPSLAIGKLDISILPSLFVTNPVLL